MGTMQIVFLFDLSVCRDFLSRPKEELDKKLITLRSACLRLLTDLSSKSPNLKWGFKFFDSRGSKVQSMQKFSFPDLTLENFETLENEISVRYERHLTFMQALEESSQKTEVSTKREQGGELTSEPPVKILQLAITQILCEFRWETMDMWSPSITKLKNRTIGRNFLFTFCDFKDDDEFLHEYFGLNSSISKPKFLNAFLPQSLRDSIVKKSDIHLVLLNTCLEQKFMGSLTSKLLPLLSHSLQTVQGSLIPLSILSQSSFNLKILRLTEKPSIEDKAFIPTFCSNYQNPLIPFSILLEQSLNKPFYSSKNASIYDCCLEFPNKNEEIPIQVTEIFKKINNIYTEGNNAKVSRSTKNNSLEQKSVIWSKFIVHFAVPNSCHFPAHEMVLCLPNNNSSVVGSLMSLNKSLCLEGIHLLLECVSKSGLKMLGLLMPLSTDCAVISILDLSYHSVVGSNGEMSITSSIKSKGQEDYFPSEIKNIKNISNKNVENSSCNSLKAFNMECLEPWFKPIENVSKSTVKPEPSNGTFKMESYWQLLKQSVQHSKKTKEKFPKQHLINGDISNSMKKGTKKRLTDEESNEKESKDMDSELLDLSYEELLSAILNIYKSAVESSGEIVSCSNRIVKAIVNYCKKQSSSFVEEDASRIFKDNLFMSAKKISEKYEMDDSEQATKNIIKECQIQVLLILWIENLKACPNRSNCVNEVITFLRLMSFYNGVKETQIFLRDIVKKSYGDNLYDILVEIGDELVISIFDDAESPNSPSDTISSELNNDDDMFSSVMSSNISEKSSSSSSSRKGKGRKLARHRSDISDTSRHRNVLLPRSGKKKKQKSATNKAVRYSPRLAAKRNEPGNSVCEKTNKVCRNLFSDDKVQCTPKKNEPSTPKGKKGNLISNVLYAPSTPFEKQNHSALYRKIFNDHLSKSPKIYVSPKINKTAKDGTSKELMEKLEKVAFERRESNGNIKQYTPESIRRLSLKLHSKQFTSPTARLGMKKCIKRLFDQISPEKIIGSNKRHKPNEETSQSSDLEKDDS